jgi:hypothetical protein
MDGRRTKIIASAAIAAIAVALGVVVWRWHDALTPEAYVASRASNTAVLGSYGQRPAQTALPRPPAPANSHVATTALDDGQQLAIWTQDGHVYGARYAASTGWTDAHALEQILGEAGDVQLAGNGRGEAIAVWRHTLGQIDSLRFARFDGTQGWSAPDVVPGVLPRHGASGAAPQLQVDAQGHATLQWPSAFGRGTMQVSRFDPAAGWSPPQDVAQAR